jgi:hypothetical protein
MAGGRGDVFRRDQQIEVGEPAQAEIAVREQGHPRQMRS